MNTRFVYTASSLFVVFLLIAIQQNFVIPESDAIMRALSNSLHIPLFVAISLCCKLALPNIRWQSLGIAILIIAVATEALQLLTARQASASDIALDLVGCAIAAIFIYLPKSVVGEMTFATLFSRSNIQYRLLPMTIVTCLLTSLLPGYQWGTQSLLHAKLPILYSPGAWPAQHFLSSNSNPAVIENEQGKSALHATWGDFQWPKLSFTGPRTNWLMGESIEIEMTNLEARQERLTLAMTLRNRGGPNWRLPFVAQPGRQTIRLPTDTCPEDPCLVRAWQIHATQADLGESIMLHCVSLVGGAWHAKPLLR